MVLAGLAHDLRSGARALGKHPWLSATAILTLGLGAGVSTAVFSWVDNVLLRPIPGATDAGRLVVVEEVPSTGQTQACAYPDFRDFQRGADLLSGLTASHIGTFTLGEGESAQRVYGQIVSANFFSVLGVQPAAGRAFTFAEDRDARGAYPYAVISHRLWKTRFLGDRGILGKSVRMNGRAITIVGVAPPAFRGSITGLALDVWVHLSMIDQMGGVGSWPVNDRNAKPLLLIGRLRPAVTVERASAQIASIARRLAVEYPATHAGTTAVALPLWKAHFGAQATLRSPLRILLAVAVLVLLIACANVANLLLARSVSRQKEFSTRLALGAGRGRLVRQVLIESAVLAVPAVAVGLLMALWLGQGLAVLLPATDRPLAGFVSVDLNPRILLFASALCLGAALLAGVAPALHSSGTDVNSALQNGSRGSTGTARSHRARSLLVMAEVALATVATVGAGLFARSFQKVSAIRLGFDSGRVHVAQLFLASAGYSADREKQFCLSLRQKLESEPGIEAASYSIELPLAQQGDEAVEIEGYTARPGESMVIPRNAVGPDYFRLLRIPIVAGREFTGRDAAQSPRTVIVNETFARRFFPGLDPVGRRMRAALGRTWATIVGVVKDSKYSSAAEGPRPYFYTPFQQSFASGHNNFFLVRTSGGAGALGALRRAIASIDNTAGIYRLQSFDEHVRGSLYAHSVAATLMGGLGMLSLVLAALGLYCVMAYAVSERSQEIGIRMALGATPGFVVRMVLKQAAGMTVWGLLTGALAALAAARLVAGALVGIGAADPVAFGLAGVLLPLIALVASYLPARRAMRVEPVSALRFQ